MTRVPRFAQGQPGWQQEGANQEEAARQDQRQGRGADGEGDQQEAGGDEGQEEAQQQAGSWHGAHVAPPGAERLGDIGEMEGGGGEVAQGMGVALVGIRTFCSIAGGLEVSDPQLRGPPGAP